MNQPMPIPDHGYAPLAQPRVGVVGLGAIGTSIGMALSSAGYDCWGYDVSVDHVKTAESRGAVSRTVTSLTGLAECNAIFICVPPGSVLAVARILREASGAVLIDVASAKGYLARELDDPRFVPSHPMRGSNLSGPAAAATAVFSRAPWVITPLSCTSKPAIELARRLIAATGAVLVFLDAQRHDRICARISHLPHIVSSAAVLTAFAADAACAASLAGGSFRDVTRVATGNPALWEDITINNKEEIVKCLDDYISRLDALRRSLANGDRAAVGSFFRRAEAALDRWLAASLSPEGTKR